jgi:hypothetical protein
MVTRTATRLSVRVRIVVGAAAAAIALVAASLPAGAHAAGWQRVTDTSGTSVDQVGLARAPDGALHVAWRRTAATSEDLLHTVISARGAVGDTSTLTAGWASLSAPALVTVPGGIRAFFGGLHSTDSGDPNNELNTALSTDGGATWSLQTGSIVAPGAQAYGSPVSATMLADGTFLQAWAGTLGTWVHSGLDPATPYFDYQAPLGNYGYDAGIASNAAGQVQLAWYSSAEGHLGVLAQQVSPAGSPAGSVVTMPDTGDMTVGMLARTPVVAVPSGEFYIAYPTGTLTQNRIRVWQVGAPSTTLVGSTTGNSVATIAAAADGRLWAVWAGGSGDDARVLVRRSNAARTRWGATVDAGRAGGTTQIYRLDASAAGGALDVLGLLSIGTSTNAATYHRRVLPGLTVQARPAGQPGRGAPRETFTVLDAGDPVRGAKVTVRGRSALTGSNGTVRLSVSRTRSAQRATVTKSGYTPARVRFRSAG